MEQVDIELMELRRSKQKLQDACVTCKRKVKDTVDKGLTWCVENPTKATILASGAGYVVGEISKHRQKAKKEKVAFIRSHRYWDPESRCFWTLNRELSQEDHKKILELRAKGYTHYGCLKRLGVLA